MEGSLTVGGEEIAVEAEISFADGVKAKGSMVISGITVGFVYTEGRVYLSVGELRGSLSAAELMKALGWDGLEIDILSLLGELTAGEDWLGVEVLGVPVTVRKTETGLSVTAEGLCTFSAVAGCESIAGAGGIRRSDGGDSFPRSGNADECGVRRAHSAGGGRHGVRGGRYDRL